MQLLPLSLKLLESIRSHWFIEFMWFIKQHINSQILRHLTLHSSWFIEPSVFFFSSHVVGNTVFYLYSAQEAS